MLFFLMEATVWLCGVRDFKALHFQTCTEPIRLFINSNFRQVVKDELAALQRRNAVEIPAGPRITYSFCYGQV
jgi:hypothetical protein